MDNTVVTKKSILQSLWRIQKIILESLDFNTVVENVVNGLLEELGYMDLGYRIIVLTLVNERKKVLERISLSSTEEAKQAMAASAIPFHDIDIPLSAQKNLLIKTFKNNKSYSTHYWPELFHPVLTDEQAIKNQKAAGIKTSMTFPLTVREKTIGVMIFSLVKDLKDVSKEERELIEGFTDIVALAVENAKLYSSLASTTERLKDANHRLKELDVLKDEFVSIASHELRTPMTAIKSYLWMAMNQPDQKLTEQTKKYLGISYQSTERLIHLVNDMLTVSRIERDKIELKVEKFDLYETAKLVYDELKITADEKKVAFTLGSEDKPPFMVKGDKEKLREVIQNIVGNSLKFTPPNGKIMINFRHDKSHIKIDVSDTGAGIPKESLSKLFQKFSKIDYSYSKHSSQPGSGLGLYISKQIVSLHHGDITVQSEVDVGTTFTVSLPAASQKGGAE
ncbi:MAG: ATP-binding protein [Weeksellaceae bacterium]